MGPGTCPFAFSSTKRPLKAFVSAMPRYILRSKAGSTGYAAPPSALGAAAVTAGSNEPICGFHGIGSKSHEVHAAVDVQHDSVDVAGFIRRKEERCVGYVPRGTHLPRGQHGI